MPPNEPAELRYAYHTVGHIVVIHPANVIYAIRGICFSHIKILLCYYHCLPHPAPVYDSPTIDAYLVFQQLEYPLCRHARSS
jgi:hypothetical protein